MNRTNSGMTALIVVAALLNACGVLAQAPGPQQTVALATASEASATSPTGVGGTSTPPQTPGAPPSTITPTSLPSATPLPLPMIRLARGDAYFSVDGRQSFVFMRNLGGNVPEQYERLLDLTRTGGSQLVRIQLDSMGLGYDTQGKLDDTWAQNWERVFDHAAHDGVDVLPVFAGWFDWNNGTPDYGYSTWPSNPLNAANGGPLKSPAELFVVGSSAQKIWLQWLKTVVQRWQGRNNIVAWEIFSEVNIATGVSESQGMAFVENAAAVIRGTDARQRPVTASLAENGAWPHFYRSAAIDFINFHPYPPSGKLDTFILQNVPQYLANYDKPVLIGESGLSALVPAGTITPTLTTADNALVGLRHAIWAALVSGAMNGRAFYWEDGFAVYFPSLQWPFIQKYANVELPVARFARGLDFDGFQPVPATFSPQVLGAALGQAHTIIGWVRDSACEPPNWNTQAVMSRQMVTLTVPGPAALWKVDFYRTQTGTDVIASTTVTRQANLLTFTLPNFSDDLAFKMTAQPDSGVIIPTVSAPALGTTNLIAGRWTGTITSSDGSFSTKIALTIQPGCKVGGVCGTVATPGLCTGSLVLKTTGGNQFSFVEQNMSGASGCVSGGLEQLQLQADGTLAFRYTYAPAGNPSLTSSGVLERP